MGINDKEGQRDREVLQEGGNCNPTVSSSEEQTLQTCMTSPKASQVAVCSMGSDWGNLQLIEDQESKIQEAREFIKKKQEDVTNLQEFIKKKQENVTNLQDVLDMRKQNNVYLKQM